MHSPWGFRGPGFPFHNAPPQGGAAGQFIRPVGADGSTQFPVIAPRPTHSPGFPGAYYGHPDMLSPGVSSPANGFTQYSFASPVSAGPSSSAVPQFPEPDSDRGFSEGPMAPRDGPQSQTPTFQHGQGIPQQRVETPGASHLSAGSQWLKSAVENELASKDGTRRSRSDSVATVPSNGAHSDTPSHPYYVDSQEKLHGDLDSHTNGFQSHPQTSAGEQNWVRAAEGGNTPLGEWRRLPAHMKHYTGC